MFDSGYEITIIRYVNNDKYAIRNKISEPTIKRIGDDSIKEVLHQAFEDMLRKMEQELGSLTQ